MNITETPLLLVDVQNGFVNDRSQHVLPVIADVAHRWLDAGGPIYMSQFTNSEDSQWERLIGWTRLRDEDEIAIHPALTDISESAFVYRKQTYSCLVDPFLADLRRNEWEEVVLCGIATDGCVLATAVDLFEFPDRQVRPVVVRDACASHAGAEVSDAGLMLIGRFIGGSQIISSAELFAAAEADGAIAD